MFVQAVYFPRTTNASSMWPRLDGGIDVEIPSVLNARAGAPRFGMDIKLQLRDSELSMTPA